MLMERMLTGDADRFSLSFWFGDLMHTCPLRPLWLCCGCGCGCGCAVAVDVLGSSCGWFPNRGAPGQGRLLRVRGHAQRIRRATAERGRERPHKLKWENQNLQLPPITGRYD